MNRIHHLVPLAVMASLIAVNPAAAEPYGTEKVRHADLDLTSAEGIAALDSRINSAVRKVCGYAFPADLHSMKSVHRCRQDTLADVQPQRSKALAGARNESIQLAARRR